MKKLLFLSSLKELLGKTNPWQRVQLFITTGILLLISVLALKIMSINEDIYGQHVQVTFLEKIRDEMKFENINALTEQIKKDVIHATRFFEK